MFSWQNGWAAKQEIGRLGKSTVGSLHPLGCFTRQGVLGLAWGMTWKTSGTGSIFKDGLGLLRWLTWTVGKFFKRSKLSLGIELFLLARLLDKSDRFLIFISLFLLVTICWVLAHKSLLSNWIIEVIHWKSGRSNNQKEKQEAWKDREVRPLAVGKQRLLAGPFGVSQPLVVVHIPEREIWSASLGSSAHPLDREHKSILTISDGGVPSKQNQHAITRRKKESRADKNNKCPCHYSIWLQATDEEDGRRKEWRRSWKLWFLIFLPYPVVFSSDPEARF